MRRIFDNCWGQYCQMLCDGILTQCTLSVFISRTMELTHDIKSELVNIREKRVHANLQMKLSNSTQNHIQHFAIIVTQKILFTDFLWVNKWRKYARFNICCYSKL